MPIVHTYKTIKSNDYCEIDFFVGHGRRVGSPKHIGRAIASGSSAKEQMMLIGKASLFLYVCVLKSKIVRVNYPVQIQLF